MDMSEPLKEFEGEIIAIVHRRNDVEEKWVTASYSVRFSKEQIEDVIHFIERYFDSYVALLE
ncbi:inorganic pyrophosphatase [Enterococcus sp. BWB1-3]|uniref:inorganic pyrophosphatase n=1 Tax=Enterococcus sp. BWB1-3 TaxID=2787713 RepID=UPI001F21764D|nr:inorganic pyrophosphatase [Enterococcus sp. BWB1-3]